MYYLTNGKFVNDCSQSKEGFSNIETTGDDKSEDGLALLGNLSLDGIVSAKGYYLADGSKIPEVVKLPKNMSINDNNIGINVRKPKTDLHMNGEFRIDGKNGSTQFNIDNNNKNIINGITTFKGSTLFDNQQLEIKNQKNENNKDGSSTFFNHQKSGKNLISGNTVFSDNLSANDITANVIDSEEINVNDFNIKKSISSLEVNTDNVKTKNLTTDSLKSKSSNIKGDGILLNLEGKDKTIVGFDRGDNQLASVGFLKSDNDFYIKGNTNDGKIRLSVGSNGTKNNNLVVSNDGNVGISKDDPKYKLDVDGTIKAKKFVNESGEDINSSNFKTKLTLNDGISITGGRSFISDKDNNGKLRLGSYDNKPGIFSEDNKDLVVGVDSNKYVNIGGKGNYFSVSGSGDLNAKGDFMLINKNGGAKIEGGDANHAIYFNKGLNGDKNQLGFHGSDSINMYTGGNINKQKKRMTIDDEGTTTFYGDIRATNFLDKNGKKINSSKENNLKKSIDTVGDDIKTFGKTFGKNIRNVENEVKNVENEVKNVENEVKNVEKEVKNVENEVKDDIKIVEKDVKDIENNLKKSIDTVGDDIKTFEKDVKYIENNLKKSIDNVGDDIKSVGKNIRNVENEVKNDIKIVEKDVKDVEGEIKDIQKIVNKFNTGSDLKLPEDANICFGENNCFNLEMLKKLSGNSNNSLKVVKGIQNRYNFESFKDGVWKDSVGKKDVKMHQGLLTKVDKSSYVKYNDGIEKGFGYLKGNTNVRLEFPMNLNRNNWTIVYVTRYDPQGRNAKGRILQGKTNWLAGHWNNRAGISHQNSWVSHHDKDKIPEQGSWIFGIEQPKKFIRRSGKHDWKTFNGGRDIGSDRIYINAGRHGNEKADFNIAELIVYNRKINDTEINDIKKYLEDKYIHAKGGVPEHTHDVIPKHEHEHEHSKGLLNSIKGIQNRYEFESFKDGVWKDPVGKKDVKMHQGILTKVDKSSYVKYSDGIEKGFGYLKGNTNVRLEFPTNLNRNNWTIVYVTRYDPQGRDADGRILQGGKSNWLAGHWHNRAGISHQNSWVSHHDKDKIPEQRSWIFGIEQPKKFIRRSGKHGWRTFNGGRDIGSDRLYINAGRHGNEKADFNIAELTIFNRKLNDTEIETVKKYLEDRYINGKVGVPEHTHDVIPKHEHEHEHSTGLLKVVKGIQNRYNLESFKDGVWKDPVGKKDVKMHQGKLTKVDKSSYVKYNDGIEKGFGYLKGNTNVRLEFPMNLNNNNWTIVYVTRYDPQGRDADGRILQGKTNWLAGHWHNRAGISHQNSWVSHHDRDKIPEQRSWILGIEQPKKFIRRSGKHGWKTFNGGRDIGSDRIYINAGGHGNERADFNIAELIVYNRKINDNEINDIKKYLEDKYIHGKDKSEVPEHKH